MRTLAMALLLGLVLSAGIADAKGERWHKLMDDADLSYFIDDKSILNTRDGTTIFWMKLASRKKDFLKNEYRMPELDYILFNYEINCDKAVYKARGVIYYNRNGRQIDKQVPTVLDMSDAEPVPPESVMEVAKNYVCPGEEEPSGTAPVPETAPAPAAQPAAQPSAPAEAPELIPEQSAPVGR